MGRHLSHHVVDLMRPLCGYVSVHHACTMCVPPGIRHAPDGSTPSLKPAPLRTAPRLPAHPRLHVGLFSRLSSPLACLVYYLLPFSERRTPTPASVHTSSPRQHLTYLPVVLSTWTAANEVATSTCESNRACMTHTTTHGTDRATVRRGAAVRQPGSQKLTHPRLPPLASAHRTDLHPPTGTHLLVFRQLERQRPGPA
jgi:hypothetical protein